MRGKTVVITGATSGIGQAAAAQLARMGTRIVQVARDRKRGEETLAMLRDIAPGLNHTVHYADLSSMRDSRRVGAEIAAAEERIDVLANNAGAMFNSPRLTEEGLERTFAVNHMSYFVLTLALWERLVRSAPARIVNTASDAYESGTLDLDDLQSERTKPSGLGEFLRYGGSGHRLYATSKLANVLFTRELARRLGASGVTANCFHPGFVATRFADNAGGLISFSMSIAKRFARKPEKGAETLVYLASAPEVAELSGCYFHDCRTVEVNAAARDEDSAKRLWRESERLAGQVAPG